MAWTPTTTADFAYGPFSFGPLLLPTTAKTVFTDTSNALKIYSSDSTHRPVISNISLTPTGTLLACKFMLFASATVGGTTLVELDEIAVAAQTSYTSTTVSGTVLTFTRWTGGTSATPLILSELQDLWIGCTVAQTTPPTVYGYGKLY
jgi:hypothetical protein